MSDEKEKNKRRDLNAHEAEILKSFRKFGADWGRVKEAHSINTRGLSDEPALLNYASGVIDICKRSGYDELATLLWTSMDGIKVGEGHDWLLLKKMLRYKGKGTKGSSWDNKLLKYVPERPATDAPDWWRSGNGSIPLLKFVEAHANNRFYEDLVKAFWFAGEERVNKTLFEFNDWAKSHNFKTKIMPPFRHARMADTDVSIALKNGWLEEETATLVSKKKAAQLLEDEKNAAQSLEDKNTDG